MNELQKVFNYGDHQVRMWIGENDDERDPWFVVQDVCRILEIENSRDALARLDADEKGVVLIDTPGGPQNMNVVNESGLYSLVLGSRKPEAKQFKRWVTHEVLPSIRKHGGYLTPAKIEEALTDPDTIIRLATALKEERTHRLVLQAQVEEQKPKALFADSVTASKTSILIGELAKILKQNGIEVGQNRLFDWMRGKGYLISRQGTDYNMPTQRSMEMGLFTIKETTVNHADGHVSISKTPKVTGRGQVYFVNKFLQG